MIKVGDEKVFRLRKSTPGIYSSLREFDGSKVRVERLVEERADSSLYNVIYLLDGRAFRAFSDELVDE